MNGFCEKKKHEQKSQIFRKYKIQIIYLFSTNELVNYFVKPSSYLTIYLNLI